MMLKAFRLALTASAWAMATTGALAQTGGTAPAAANAADAAKIHRDALVLDAHVDVLLPATPKRYYLPDGGSRVDLARLTQGGVDAVVFSVAVGSGPRDAAGVAAARKEADAKLGWIKALAVSNPDRVAIARSADDVEKLHQQGKVAVIIGFLNARSIGRDIGQIDHFYREGVRVFGLAHSGHNDFADSSRPQVGEPVAEHKGLSALGRSAVARLNDLGILIDVSQLSTDALLQTASLSRAPVVASHSAARALVDNVRNLSDAELDAIKAKGGVVQVTPFTSYLQALDAASQQRIDGVRARHKLAPLTSSIYDGTEGLSADARTAYLDEVATVRPKATVAEYVDHIDYIAKRIGWQHVGVGTDFDHGAGVTGFDSAADAPNVTTELLRRGYTAEQIKAIWGGNFLRVLRAAEAGRAK